MRGSAFRGTVAAAVAAASIAAAGRPVGAQSGQLDFTGTVDLFQPVPGPGQNLVVDFLPPPGMGTGTVHLTGGGSGVFALLAPFTPGSHVDLVFGPAGAPAPTAVPSTILTLGGYAFTVTGFAPGTFVGTPLTLQQVAGSTMASMGLVGTVTGPGLAGASPFSGGYSMAFPGVTIAQLAQTLEAGLTVRSTIQGTFVTAIPEPSTYALMATGLIGLTGAGWRRRHGLLATRRT
jgi:hypothetical protein